MAKQYKFSKIREDYPKHKEMPFTFNQGIVEKLAKKLEPQGLRDDIIKIDEMCRKERLYGHYDMADNDGKVRLTVNYRWGVVQSAWLSAYIEKNGVDIAVIKGSVMNDKVDFKKNKKFHKAEHDNVQKN